MTAPSGRSPLNGGKRNSRLGFRFLWPQKHNLPFPKEVVPRKGKRGFPATFPKVMPTYHLWNEEPMV